MILRTKKELIEYTRGYKTVILSGGRMTDLTVMDLPEGVLKLVACGVFTREYWDEFFPRADLGTIVNKDINETFVISLMGRAKNFQEEFSREDILLVKKSMATYDCGPSLIRLVAPEYIYDGFAYTAPGRDRVSCRCRYRTLKMEFAIRVFATAIAIAYHTMEDYLKGWRWRAVDGAGFNDLYFQGYYTNETIEELCVKFWAVLEQIANSETIWVNEGYFLESKGMSFDSMRCSTGLNWAVIKGNSPFENRCRIGDDNMISYPYDRTYVTYKWDDIKDFFCQLTINQMRLVLHDSLHNHTPLDDELLKACYDWDKAKIVDCLNRGANINCLDKNGESVLQQAVEFFSDHGINWSEELTREERLQRKKENLEKCIDVVDLLLENGADINLFGYEGAPPIFCAYRENSAAMVEYLLDEGADPNVNCYLMDDGFFYEVDKVQCSILDCIYDDPDDSTEDEAEIERLIIAAGGKRYVE